MKRGRISPFSDIDLLAIFEQARPARELTRWVYENIRSREAVDILAYSQEEFERRRNRPFLRRILEEGKVLYGRPA